jgi:hypothetical protein
MKECRQISLSKEIKLCKAYLPHSIILPMGRRSQGDYKIHEGNQYGHENQPVHSEHNHSAH